ncbi:uncharacterized protein LOC111608417 [Xiphophorus maculatus]|uniref:uncharacterized protein LOC111608417 n=1 Tax=Xiphophorus maculatus TaxID=8083 RepID=UPI000C6DF8BB|nr:uncharacterized protein LOC111608417 [Xiphophorus maculatus]XP_023188208.1 uncharacterized protein LOC111608417 [Xiphophorus maculatus]
MLHRLKLGVLLQWLILLLSSPAYKASSLGLTVHVVPLEVNGGKTVRAHFSVITPSPCPDLLAVCAAGEDCQAHRTIRPFNYTKPSPAWCVRQWQKTVPSNYNTYLKLGFQTEFYVSINADPKIRANNGKLNRPPFVALPPPLRASVNCPVDFHISTKDLDGDKVRCRFARADTGECRDCFPHNFLELDEASCTLTFTGNAAAGQYFIYLMAEDLIPSPPSRQFLNNSPLSSVPVHLSLTVEKSASGCSYNPLVLDGTPERDSVQFVLPFQEVKFNANYKSDLESVLEIAVVGPPDLYRVGFASISNLAKLTMAWIRSENNLTQLLPVCFVANTNSFQSHLRCTWLYQREMRTLPDGTELRCNQTEMSLLLPVTSLTNVDLDELQLNSPTCPVTHNSTHLTAHIPLGGCGTKAVHSGTELVYTNTLKSVHHTMISRQPSLILPLACRIPGAQAKLSQYAVSMPTERETFGEFTIRLDFYLPGQGPLARLTSTPRFRSNFLLSSRFRRETGSESRTSISSTQTTPQPDEIVKQLDLHVMSNCSIDRAEMIVTGCVESETEDFTVSHPILEKGCMTSNNTLEIITDQKTFKIYRLNIKTLAISGTKMYIECKINLCIATMPSDTCPDLCSNSSSSSSSNSLVHSLFSSTYSVRSGPVSLLVADYLNKNTTTTNLPPSNAPPTTGLNPSQPATTPGSTPPASQIPSVTSTNTNTTASQAPEVATSRITGVILMTIAMCLQMTILQ